MLFSLPPALPHRLRLVVFLSLLCLMPAMKAQIVNTESKRLNSSKEGFTGNVDLLVNYTSNTVTFFEIGNKIRLQYQKKRNLVLLLNDVSFLRAQGKSLLNKGFSHLRYNHEFKPYLIAETFVQGQYDEVRLIKARALAGAGPRFKIIKNDSVRVFAAALYMFEYEQEQNLKEAHLDHRLSIYLSAEFAITKIFAFRHITYYQPRINFFRDFRISTESQLEVKLFKNLIYKAVFGLLLDTRPPDTVPPLSFSIKNTLGYSF